jgi:hypothetical protein
VDDLDVCMGVKIEKRIEPEVSVQEVKTSKKTAKKSLSFHEDIETSKLR